MLQISSSSLAHSFNECNEIRSYLMSSIGALSCAEIWQWPKQGASRHFDAGGQYFHPKRRPQELVPLPLFPYLQYTVDQEAAYSLSKNAPLDGLMNYVDHEQEIK